MLGNEVSWLAQSHNKRTRNLSCGRFRTQSPVALAISSPTFLGDRPRGPILGARADEAPTSPPVALRWLLFSHIASQYPNA